MAERSYYRWSNQPLPHATQQRGKESRVKECNEAWERGGKLFLTTQIYFVDDALNQFSPSCVFLPLRVTGKQSPCLYLSPQGLSSCFILLRRGSEWVAGWVKANPTQKVSDTSRKTGERWGYWRVSSKGPLRWLRACSISDMRKS